MASPADADANLKRALEQLNENEAAVAEAINEARAEHARSEPPLAGSALLERIDQLTGQRSLDSQDAAILCNWPDAASIGQAWFELKHPGKSVPSPMLVLDAYLVGAPPFLSKAQRDQVGDWYRSKVSANPEYTDAVTGAAKAFVLIGDLNASAAGMAWQTIIPDLLEQGHDLEFNVTKEQVTAAAARWIVAVADTFTPPSLD
ncbi:hypothetical protein [Synechococcus sp. MU1617]|uniref:hypothetical protein n=1 Tax=Synechococcus sp. MU1617 TaxID=2508346 RepID=UPI001CF8E8B8|nr:hypothetical protein [Synechococcus sp. MU1617]MCB4389960.1 pseudouridine-5'-phosphate glycosidase [Synechococcus sp. MU1617]